MNLHCEDLKAYMVPTNKDGWKTRYNRQVRPIHLASYVLNPANQNVLSTEPFSAGEEDRLKEWMKAQADEVYDAYLDYSTAMGAFGAEEDISNPKRYWQEK